MIESGPNKIGFQAVTDFSQVSCILVRVSPFVVLFEVLVGVQNKAREQYSSGSTRSDAIEGTSRTFLRTLVTIEPNRLIEEESHHTQLRNRWTGGRESCHKSNCVRSIP
jgi:hypothetical protein